MSNEKSTSNPARSDMRPRNETADPSGMSLSMHDGVDVSCDCCSCEAEPYWIEALARQDDSAQTTKERAPPK